MRRYQGEPLPEGCRVAVISNDALGNYVVATPLIQMLRRELKPSSLHYYGGTRTEELWVHDPDIDWGYPFFGSDPGHAVLNYGVETEGEVYDLVVNLEEHPWAKSFAAVIGWQGAVVGPCLGIDGRGDLPQADDAVGRLAADPKWVAEDLVHRYPFLESGWISEIFSRLAYLKGPVPPYRIVRHDPGTKVPEVLIATAASLGNKLWPVEKWREVLRWLHAEDASVGLLGAKPADQRKFWKGDSMEDVLVEEGLVEDLRGKLSLTQVAGALEAADAVLTIDNGILHLACATPTQVVGLFRHGIHRLWAPPVPNVRVLTPGEGREVADISVEAVKEALACALTAC
ncbi:MAG TPA: glycosyltransferase family 9 protein [Fimbriimonas sp.]